MLTLFALPSVTSAFRISLQSSGREIASRSREAYNAAVLSGRTHRLAFDLKNHRYWVESGPTGFLLDTAETLDRESRRKRFGRTKGDDKPPPTKFQLAGSITRKEITLPRGVVFEDVMTEQSKDPIVSGMAYAHIFPHGLSESALVHLKDQDQHQMTLILDAVGGRARAISRYVKSADESETGP